MEAANPHSDAQHVASPSLWWDGLERAAVAPPLETDTTADIAIMGGGYTGLWTAYFLKQIQPDLDIALVEAKHIGHGASGRNGGWLMGALEGCDAFTDDSGTLPIEARQQLTQLVSRAGEIFAKEGIDCDFHHGGCVVAAARHDAQVARAQKMLGSLRGLGFGEDDYHWLTPTELDDRIHVANPGGAVFTPHVARIQPAKLVTGLARVVKALGVRAFEHTRAHAIHPGVIRCDRGSIQAGQIVIATEGYSEAGNPLHRRLIPVQTGMVATEPLSDAQWSGLGFANNETFADCTRAATYLQRTADNRLVIGARGHYQPGGVPQHGLGDSPATGQRREKIALSLFPQLPAYALPTTGAAAWACPAAGTRMSSTTLTPVSLPRVATSVKASAPAFCLAKRWLNCSRKSTQTGHKCHGWRDAHSKNSSAGNQNRFRSLVSRPQ